MVPSHLRPLFWDVDTDTFDPPAHPAYTIARVLEYGDERAVAWLRTTFLEDQVCDVLRSEHRLSRKSATFWALVYDVPPGDVAALR